MIVLRENNNTTQQEKTMTIKFQKFDEDTMEIRSTDAITSINSRGYVGEIVKDMSPINGLWTEYRVSGYTVEICNDFNVVATKEFDVNGTFYGGAFGTRVKEDQGYETARKALSAAKAWARETIAAMNVA